MRLFLFVESQNNRFITCSFLCFCSNDSVGLNADHGYWCQITAIVEYLSHSYFLCNQTFHSDILLQKKPCDFFSFWPPSRIHGTVTIFYSTLCCDAAPVYCLISTSTPAGSSSFISESITSAVGSRMSIIRLCVLISNCSRDFL